ncbi:hypothetical protein BHE74_00054780 [Ensete ventricosum]|nr:hypothetical protein BHE74_00054780 [Ensete ventricosum]RZR80232.1 hypothetical protein BHM03_00006183 [Ensete ventricosum]
MNNLFLVYDFKCWYIQGTRNENATGPTFSDEEDTRQMLSISKSAQRRGGASRRGRGRGRGSSNLKQMTLDGGTMRTRHSERLYCFNHESLCHEPEEISKDKGRKRGAPRGRGRGSTSSAKRGRKSDFTSIQSMLMNNDGDDDDEDDISTRLKKVQPQVCTLISDRLLFYKLGKPVD